MIFSLFFSGGSSLFLFLDYIVEHSFNPTQLETTLFQKTLKILANQVHYCVLIRVQLSEGNGRNLVEHPIEQTCVCWHYRNCNAYQSGESSNGFILLGRANSRVEVTIQSSQERFLKSHDYFSLLPGNLLLLDYIVKHSFHPTQLKTAI
jgi:hypothetical protein